MSKMLAFFSKRSRGQASLETLLVFVVYFLLTGFFILSVFFLLGRVTAQGMISQATKEVASLGCVPTLTEGGTSYNYNKDWLEGMLETWGARVQGDITWKYDDLSGGSFSPTKTVPSCDTVFAGTEDPVPSGDIIKGTAVYKQNIPIFSGNNTISFTMSSSSLEDGG